MELLFGVLLVLPGVVGQGRSGADEGHVSLDDVEKLRELVERKGAHETSDPGNAGIAGFGIDSGTGVFSVLNHGTKLVYPEYFPLISNPVLLEQYGPAGIQQDYQRTYQDKGREDEQRKNRNQQIKTALYDGGIYAVV
jgi:hypothetical protein